MSGSSERCGPSLSRVERVGVSCCESDVLRCSVGREVCVGRYVVDEVISQLQLHVGFSFHEYFEGHGLGEFSDGNLHRVYA